MKFVELTQKKRPTAPGGGLSEMKFVELAEEKEKCLTFTQTIDEITNMRF